MTKVKYFMPLYILYKCSTLYSAGIQFTVVEVIHSKIYTRAELGPRKAGVDMFSYAYRKTILLCTPESHYSVEFIHTFLLSWYITCNSLHTFQLKLYYTDTFSDL